MENTIDNKQKFFGQYYNQFVYRLPDNDDKLRVFDWFKWENGWLELKPLSSISEVDAIEVAKIHFRSPESKTVDTFWAKNLITAFSGREDILSASVIDYLRSRGYALPWNGLSVEKQIEYGWVKLVD